MLDVMSFYYLFIPTWFFTIIIYTILAAQYGAKKQYPEAKAKEQKFDSEVEAYQLTMADQEPKFEKDRTLFSKVLRAVAYTALAVTLVLAVNVLFGSPSEADYIANRDVFYFNGLICTLLYFATAYWAMKRGKHRLAEI